MASFGMCLLVKCCLNSLRYSRLTIRGILTKSTIRPCLSNFLPWKISKASTCMSFFRSSFAKLELNPLQFDWQGKSKPKVRLPFRLQDLFLCPILWKIVRHRFGTWSGLIHRLPPSKWSCWSVHWSTGLRRFWSIDRLELVLRQGWFLLTYSFGIIWIGN